MKSAIGLICEQKLEGISSWDIWQNTITEPSNTKSVFPCLKICYVTRPLVVFVLINNIPQTMYLVDTINGNYKTITRWWTKSHFMAAIYSFDVMTVIIEQNYCQSTAKSHYFHKQFSQSKITSAIIIRKRHTHRYTISYFSNNGTENRSRGAMFGRAMFHNSVTNDIMTVP